LSEVLALALLNGKFVNFFMQYLPQLPCILVFDGEIVGLATLLTDALFQGAVALAVCACVSALKMGIKRGCFST
jgi:hypothetical protein